MEKDFVKIAIVGHVDHGKSTLVGRLLYDTGSLPEGKFEQIKSICKKKGEKVEFAFLLDVLEEEQNQGITIDVAHTRFSTENRNFILIDVPGHKEFLKNMISGASYADSALLLIDASEGIKEQSRRHGYILNLLGISQVVVVVNKMDLVRYDFGVFDNIKKEFKKFLAEINMNPLFFVPVSSKYGDNIVKKSCNMSWFDGPSLIECLDSFEERKQGSDLGFRLPIQDVYKFDDRRIIAGKIESGKVNVGDKIIFSPSNKEGIVKTIEKWNVADKINEAEAGESVGIVLQNQIFIERGEICSHSQKDMPLISNMFNASIFWMGNSDLKIHEKYTLKLTTQEVPFHIINIKRVIDSSTLDSIENKEIKKDCVAEITIKTDKVVAFDNFSYIHETGRFVIVDNKDVCGGGIIDIGQYPNRRNILNNIKSENIQWHENKISKLDRARQKKHKGAVIWLTGLPSSGKSTLAAELENELFKKEIHSYVLDGDNIRHGLNSNLGFSPEDRVENIRRIGEVAKLFCSAGLIVITAFISPYKEDRDRIRKIVDADEFIEVYLDCPIQECIKRDSRNLYKKALSGEIKEFTGISSPYEPPENPEVILDTSRISAKDCVFKIIDYLIKKKLISYGSL